MKIKQYRDYEGNSVKIGDSIEKVTPWEPEEYSPLGTVTEMRKEGFYVWIKTDKQPRWSWGKFTRKVNTQ